MGAAVSYLRADILQVCKFTAIVWACFVVIRLGQVELHAWDYMAVFAGILLPALFAVVLAVRGLWFALLYYIHGRDFERAYSRMRRPAGNLR